MRRSSCANQISMNKWIRRRKKNKKIILNGQRMYRVPSIIIVRVLVLFKKKKKKTEPRAAGDFNNNIILGGTHTVECLRATTKTHYILDIYIYIHLLYVYIRARRERKKKLVFSSSTCSSYVPYENDAHNVLIGTLILIARRLFLYRGFRLWRTAKVER